MFFRDSKMLKIHFLQNKLFLIKLFVISLNLSNNIKKLNMIIDRINIFTKNLIKD